VFISADLKRPASSARSRLAYLARQAIKFELSGLKAKGRWSVCGSSFLQLRSLLD
jgi:hypothetical protein